MLVITFDVLLCSSSVVGPASVPAVKSKVGDFQTRLSRKQIQCTRVRFVKETKKEKLSDGKSLPNQ
jgi:hypothetical protein